MPCMSFAAPNEEALELLAARAPLVEIGAGTGYWARCLAERGAHITAYDSNPPAPDSEATNAFHGHLPAFTDVKRGGPKAASGSKHALFLCYPPPGDKMAFNCLRRYRWALAPTITLLFQLYISSSCITVICSSCSEHELMLLFVNLNG